MRIRFLFAPKQYLLRIPSLSRGLVKPWPRVTRCSMIFSSAARNLVNASVPEGLVMKIGEGKTRSVFDRYNVSSAADLTGTMDRWEAASLELQSQADQKALTDGN